MSHSVRISRCKRAVSVRAIEVLLYFVYVHRLFQSMVWCGTNVTLYIGNPCSEVQVKSALLENNSTISSFIPDFDIDVCSGIASLESTISFRILHISSPYFKVEVHPKLQISQSKFSGPRKFTLRCQ